MFHSVDCKLGNMRKVQNWTVYPANPDDTDVTIQCENRIAKVNLATGDTVLSTGKGGHQGHMMLCEIFKPFHIACPADVLTQLQAIVAKMTGKQVTLVSG